MVEARKSSTRFAARRRAGLGRAVLCISFFVRKSGRKRLSPRIVLCLALILSGASAGPVAAPQSQEEAPEVAGKGPARLYASLGLGFVNLDREIGVGIPLGITGVMATRRLIWTLDLLDLGLMEGDDRDPRYYRPVVGHSICVDSQTGWQVPDYYCSGGTDLVGSASVDLSYVFFDQVWIGDQPGRLFGGLGRRFAHPETWYGTMGIYFDARSRSAGGIKLAVGSKYVNLGVVWGFDLLRFF